MLNYWWVTRPKRKLNSVPEVLATFADLSLNQEWDGQRDSHLAYEEALENAGLKRLGERRDHTGGGARTYKAWLVSLGLIFVQNSTGRIKLTLAGEAIINGDSPVKILTEQIMKYQFPSAFSVGRGVDVSRRFKIRPFRFLLRLLLDSRINYLTEDEIARIIVTEAENETERCFEYIVERILQYRTCGDDCLRTDFFEVYGPSKGTVNIEHPFSHLDDLANTIINWLDYTQFIYRENGCIAILDERRNDVIEVLAQDTSLIDRPEDHEYFQRKYGLDPKHKKDNRNLNMASVITARTIALYKINAAYIALAVKKPITKVTPEIVDSIFDTTGINKRLIEEILLEKYPVGSIGAFMTRYFEMAFNGKDDATEFEKATVELFRDVFNFQTKHVGPIGLTPDVLLVSDEIGYQAIIDNKAYGKYSISNDHYNRMVYNYIGNLARYSSYGYPLAFFSYIAGGFGSNIDKQIRDIHFATGVNGSAVSVSNVIRLVENNQSHKFTHLELKELFGVNRLILAEDILFGG